MSKFKNALQAACGLLLLSNALILTPCSTAQAQSPGVSLASLVARLNSDDAEIASLQSQITALKNNPTPGPTGPKGDTGPIGPKGPTGNTGAQGPAGAGLTSSNLALLKTMSLSSDPYAGGTNTLLTFTGVNVQIVNGLGATNGEPTQPDDTDTPVVNGIGNLIVGYDEASEIYATARTGSHNLIVGIGNNYSSFGGLVAGTTNDVAGPFTSITGGSNNLASGFGDSISGGRNNTTTGLYDVISGGSHNTVQSGSYASISGGENSFARGQGASVSGGIANQANGQDASVTGGFSNQANGTNAAIAGGLEGTALGNNSAISGGAGVFTGGSYSPVFNQFNQLIGSHYDGAVPGAPNGYTWDGGIYFSPLPISIP